MKVLIFLSVFLFCICSAMTKSTFAHQLQTSHQNHNEEEDDHQLDKKFRELDSKLHQHRLHEDRQRKQLPDYTDYFAELEYQKEFPNSGKNKPSLLASEQQFLIHHTNNISHRPSRNMKGRFVHKCMHDHKDHADIIARHLRENTEEQKMRNTGAKLGRIAASLAVEGIRVVYSDADLNNTAKYCTAVGETKPDFRGGTTTCRAEDIFTDAKRLILTTKVLPAALGNLKKMLAMEPLVSPIIVPQSACSGLGYTIPASHSTTGVSNAEYVIYISAGRTPDGVIAFAGGCGSDSAGRLIYGRANFGPQYLVWDEASPASNNDIVKTGTHELFHALGFSYQVFQSKGLTASVSNVRGKTVTVHTGAIAVARARDFFGCSSLTNVELEDEGGSGSALSHPDKRLFPHDFMAASGGTLISTTSIAMLADEGHYAPLWDIVQNSTFGQGAGCNFVSQKCDQTSAGRDKYFCFDSSVTDVCNYDFTAAGFCGVSTYSSNLPSYFQYFSDPKIGGNQFLDMCPVINSYSNRICNGERQATQIDYTLGFTFARQSRCFKSENVIRSGLSSSGLGNTRCLVSQCVDNGQGGKAIQFKINGSSWIECATEGQRITGLPGYDGTIICPTSFSSFCSYYDIVPAPPDGFPADYVGSGGSGNDPYGQVPTVPGSIVWIRGDLIFSGQGWGNLSGVVPPKVIAALQRDLAFLIGVTVRETFVTSAAIEPTPTAGSDQRVLHVYYFLTNQDLTLDTVSNRLENVRVKQSTAWLSNTRSEYATSTGYYDSPVLYQHKEDYELSYLERLFMGLGIGPFSGVVVAGFILVCIVVAIFFCFCKESCCPGAGGSQTGIDSNFGQSNAPSPTRTIQVKPRNPLRGQGNGNYGNDHGFDAVSKQKAGGGGGGGGTKMPRRP